MLSPLTFLRMKHGGTRRGLYCPKFEYGAELDEFVLSMSSQRGLLRCVVIRIDDGMGTDAEMLNLSACPSLPPVKVPLRSVNSPGTCGSVARVTIINWNAPANVFPLRIRNRPRSVFVSSYFEPIGERVQSKCRNSSRDVSQISTWVIEWIHNSPRQVNGQKSWKMRNVPPIAFWESIPYKVQHMKRYSSSANTLRSCTIWNLYRTNATPVGISNFFPVTTSFEL